MMNWNAAANLRANDENVAEDGVRGVRTALLLETEQHCVRVVVVVVALVVRRLVEVVGDADGSGAEDDHKHARPVVRVQLALEYDDGQEATEEHNAAPEHLETARVRVEQADVQQGGAHRVAERRHEKRERLDKAGVPLLVLVL